MKWSRAMKDDLWDLHQEHPGWSTRRLADDMGLPFGAVDNALYKLKAARREQWLEAAELGFFDIEASNLDANVGYLLSWALVMPDGEVKWDLIKKKEIFSGYLDKRIVKSAVKAIQEVDVVVTYYGTRFDMPFLRARALANGIEYPSYGQVLHQDIYFHCRTLFKLSNKRMGTVAQFLGLEEKHEYDVSVWNKARLGDAEALGSVLDHNLVDAVITKQIWECVNHYIKGTRRSI